MLFIEMPAEGKRRTSEPTVKGDRKDKPKSKPSKPAIDSFPTLEVSNHADSGGGRRIGGVHIRKVGVGDDLPRPLT
jgi:hypothetical protein